MKAVAICSGGVDSTTLLYDVKQQGYDVSVLSFNYGQKHYEREIRCVTETCKKLSVEHKILDLSVLNEVAESSLTRKEWKIPEGHYAEKIMGQTVVPNRNMVMLSLAVAYAISKKADKVFYGAHAGDHFIYADCRPEFVSAMRTAIFLCDDRKIGLEAPYSEMDKGDIVKRGFDLGVDYSLTYTCYQGREKSCGRCGSCTERLEAFQKAGGVDPIEYEEKK